MSRTASEKIQALRAEVERLTVRAEDAERAASAMAKQLKEAHAMAEDIKKTLDDRGE